MKKIRVYAAKKLKNNKTFAKISKKVDISKDLKNQEISEAKAENAILNNILVVLKDSNLKKLGS